MSKLVTSLIAGDTSLSALTIQAGESIELDLDWRNSNGSEREMGASTVDVIVYMLPDRRVTYTTTLSNKALLSIPGSTTEGWTPRRTYHAEVWETAGDGTVQAGHFQISVGD